MSRETRKCLAFVAITFVLLVVAVGVAWAQDMPQPKPILDLNYYVAKIRTLEFERDQALQYVSDLRTKLDEVQKENTALKEKAKKHEK